MQLPGEFSPFIEKKVVFCLVVGGGLPPLPPQKKIKNIELILFMLVSHDLTLISLQS